ncbi:hypothetical protein ACIBSV_11260 [Embleya sp. NPDC050154]|uniref:hypothetical protein n=1 Tax=Embleya sp. NPDC050154 TaxID=3363988 RepID=UPI003787682E
MNRRVAKFCVAVALAFTTVVSTAGRGRGNRRHAFHPALHIGNAATHRVHAHPDIVDNDDGPLDVRTDGYGVSMQLRGKANGVRSTR